jgi:hypothetical protein
MKIFIEVLMVDDVVVLLDLILHHLDDWTLLLLDFA